MSEDEKNLSREVRKLIQEHHFMEFDSFFIKRMGISDIQNISEGARREAYETFCRRIGEPLPASVPTVKKWFGIGGKTVPSREIIYEICIRLNEPVAEAEKYLTQGLREPSFQINDYQETIYLYGLENRLLFQECEEMIETYEREMSEDVIFSHTHSTHELMEQFQLKKNVPRGDFLNWMLGNASYFKGYSKTALDYLVKYRSLILNQIRADSEICLNALLNETGYRSWKRMRFRRETEEESIRRYIYISRKIPEELRKNILELVQIVYARKEINAVVIREIFSSGVNNSLRQKLSKSMIFQMTEKRMSDLFGVAVQKERQIRITQAITILKVMPEKEFCPEWVLDWMKEQLHVKRKIRVREALQILTKYQKEQKRRSLLIQRSDLLPMVLYVVQHHYMEEIEYQFDLYKQEDALQEFQKVANSILAACNMALLDDSYALDAMLFTCFQKEVMYSYAEIVDVIEETFRKESTEK